MGFYSDYLSVEKKINDKVTELLNKYSDATIAITGQSLGGALSTFSAIELQLKFGKVT